MRLLLVSAHARALPPPLPPAPCLPPHRTHTSDVLASGSTAGSGAQAGLRVRADAFLIFLHRGVTCQPFLPCRRRYYQQDLPALQRKLVFTVLSPVSTQTPRDGGCQRRGDHAHQSSTYLVCM